MDISDIKNEVYIFMDKLYGSLREELYLCSNLREINEAFDEEYINICDYGKVLQSKLLSRSEDVLLDKNYNEDKMKVVKELEDIVEYIHITHVEIDESKLYDQKEDKAIFVEEKKNEKNSTKIVVVMSGILIGFIFGIVLKRDILNGIIMGFIGAAFGFAAYEMYFAGDNKNYEKVIRKDRIMNKRLDKKYLDTLIEERKRNIESSLINYINNYNCVFESQIKKNI